MAYTIRFSDLVALLCILYQGCSQLLVRLGKFPTVGQLAAKAGFDVASYLPLPSWFSPWRPWVCWNVERNSSSPAPPRPPDSAILGGNPAICYNKPSKRMGCRMFKMCPRLRCSPLSRRNKVPSFLPQGHQAT